MSINPQIKDHPFAMVALTDGGIDAARIAERLKQVPMLREYVRPPMEREAGGPIMIPLGDEAVLTFIEMAFAIPPATLEAPIARAFGWPEAKNAFAGSKSHVIVSVLGNTTDPRFMKTNALLVTHATAVVAAEDTARGVYWCRADAVTAPKAFVEQAKVATQDEPPIDLWMSVDFAIVSEADRTVIARTRGLEPFLGREVECGPYAMEPGELARIVRMVGWYAVAQDVQFTHGATVGTDEQPFARVLLGRSKMGADMIPVIGVELVGGGGVAAAA